MSIEISRSEWILECVILWQCVSHVKRSERRLESDIVTLSETSQWARNLVNSGWYLPRCVY